MIAAELALRDARHDARTFLGLALALASVLAPLLVLLAMKTGIAGALLDELRTAPDTLRIDFAGDQTISPERYSEIAALQGVGFVAPLPRGISSTVELVGPELRAEYASLWSTGPGDPMLGGLAAPEPGEVVLSPRVAGNLRVGPGDEIAIVLANVDTGAAFERPLRVIGISERLTARFVLVRDQLAFAADAVQRGVEVPALDIPGRPDTADAPDITRLRLFAADLARVAEVESRLTAMGFVVESQGERIDSILRLEQNMNRILLTIGGLSGAGFMIALAISLGVNVDRKRRSLAMLNLMGTPTRDLMVFPVIQGLLVAIVGIAMAFALFAGVAAILNATFADGLPAGARIVTLPLGDVAWIVAGTLLASATAACLGGLRIARLEPKEALRDA